MSYYYYNNMGLDNVIFDHLVDHPDIPISHQQLYNMLLDSGELTKTRASLDDFRNVVNQLPKNFHGVHEVYLHNAGDGLYEPSLVFTNKEKAEMMDELYTNNNWVYDNDSPRNSVLDDEFGNYLDFYVDNYSHLPSTFCASAMNNQMIFEVAKSGKTVLMEKFLDLHPEALYWTNHRGETVMDLACDVDDNDMQNLIAAALIRDKLNKKSDELLDLQEQIAILRTALIRRTAEGVIAAIFTGLLGYFLGRMGVDLMALIA